MFRGTKQRKPVLLVLNLLQRVQSLRTDGRTDGRGRSGGGGEDAWSARSGCAKAGQRPASAPRTIDRVREEFLRGKQLNVI